MIRILSDSSTLYSISEGQANKVDISPLVVTINNKTYMEYEEINSEEFLKLINDGHVPKSSQPPIGHVLDLYSKYPEDEIINISMADGLSGTYNSACMARNMDNNPDRIEVINSKTLCGPHKYLVDLAVRLVDKGHSKEEIIKEINDLIETSKSFLIPHDFDFLVRGGRISSLVGKIGSVIKLVPIMTLSEDKKSLVKFSAKRSFKKAIKKVTENLLEENIDSGYKIYISHASNLELASEANEIISQEIKDADIEIKELGPVFITQGGPSCIAIQVIKKHEELK
ncbi:DegV family protein [Clostridium sp. AL.422]|uniref:DegV family protein n=1 Tax=Clostridium TaxID=1485 RepID=UPI00293DD5A0|nr:MULTISPECIES: DegV family protein [unclassified Clostridium]MDV4150506.1 DegV family protein [Clostridium sp. AL.422]